MGPDPTDTADIKLTFTGEAPNIRKWEMKVAQIPCYSEYSQAISHIQKCFTIVTSFLLGLRKAVLNGAMGSQEE